MRILYGITKSNWGGAQRYVFDMAVSAQGAGHEVAVLAGGEGILVEKLRAAGIRIVSLPRMERDVKLKAEVRSFIDIYRILRKEKPDIFHINSSKMGGLGALAARLAGIKKIIFTAHGWAFNEPRHWTQKLIIEEFAWLTVLFSHITICVSEAIRRDIERKPFVANKLKVIHHGVDVFNLKPKKKSDHLVVGTISELHRVKGVDVAIKGFARAFKYTDAIFEIIGSGEELESLQKLAKELGVESQVRFLGFRENARELLSQFDIFLLTSRSEALGYVLLEAGIASLPVVATSVGGIPEIIKDRETGLMVPKDRPEAIAEALKKLSGSPEEMRRLGDSLNKLVKKEFSKEKMARETLSLYQ